MSDQETGSVKLAAAQLLWRIDRASRASIAAKMRSLLRDRRCLLRMAGAIRSSRARIYDDASYEQYLDSITASLVESCADAANRGDEHGSAVLRESAEIIASLRRTRDELRNDLEKIGQAFAKGQAERLDAGEAPL